MKTGLAASFFHMVAAVRDIPPHVSVFYHPKIIFDDYVSTVFLFRKLIYFDKLFSNNNETI